MRARLTYANVVSTIALFIALGGGAVYAAGKIGSKDIAKNAVKSKHVKADSLKGGDVAEDTLGTVPSASSAATAQSAASANPEAFAHVLTDGSVDTVNSKGIGPANITYNGTDTYCFGDLPFQPRGGQITEDYEGAFNDTGYQLGLGTITGCPADTQAWVYRFEIGTGASVIGNFFVAFYR